MDDSAIKPAIFACFRRRSEGTYTAGQFHGPNLWPGQDYFKPERAKVPHHRVWMPGLEDRPFNNVAALSSRTRHGKRWRRPAQSIQGLKRARIRFPSGLRKLVRIRTAKR
jgi:hypothetical protein